MITGMSQIILFCNLVTMTTIYEIQVLPIYHTISAGFLHTLLGRKQKVFENNTLSEAENIISGDPIVLKLTSKNEFSRSIFIYMYLALGKILSCQFVVK